MHDYQQQSVHMSTLCIISFFCVFQYLPEMNKIDPDQLLGLALEVIPNNSCLVFCATKKHCENLAHTLAKMMAKYRRYPINCLHIDTDKCHLKVHSLFLVLTIFNKGAYLTLKSIFHNILV